MTRLGILHCWLQIWCLKCSVAFPVACGVINCGGLAPPFRFFVRVTRDTRRSIEGRFFIPEPYPHCLTLNDSSTSFRPSTRVLVRPIGLDMVEVGGSNPPGPTKILSLCFYSPLVFQNRAFWIFSGRERSRQKVEGDGSIKCYWRSIRHRASQARTPGVQPPKAMAIEGSPASSNK